MTRGAERSTIAAPPANARLAAFVGQERRKNAAPALPDRHPFLNVLDTYWSSTTSAFEPDWAWAMYLKKGAIGVGEKGGRHFFVWADSTLRRP
jgi:hypothetical protein